MSEQAVCTSCSRDITNLAGTAKFQCPQCMKSTIVRCKHCREIVVKYKCPLCGFVGPN
ncbi:MAG: zinc finger domain-containing protein [Candidatus Woesearchaeota archaeon]